MKITNADRQLVIDKAQRVIEETVKLLESTLTAILTETENQVKNFII